MALAKALRPIYTARPRAALEPFYEFVDPQVLGIPAIVRLWENAWAELVPFRGFG